MGYRGRGTGISVRWGSEFGLGSGLNRYEEECSPARTLNVSQFPADVPLAGNQRLPACLPEAYIHPQSPEPTFAKALYWLADFGEGIGEAAGTPLKVMMP